MTKEAAAAAAGSSSRQQAAAVLAGGEDAPACAQQAPAGPTHSSLSSSSSSIPSSASSLACGSGEVDSLSSARLSADALNMAPNMARRGEPRSCFFACGSEPFGRGFSAMSCRWMSDAASPGSRRRSCEGPVAIFGAGSRSNRRGVPSIDASSPSTLRFCIRRCAATAIAAFDSDTARRGTDCLAGADPTAHCVCRGERCAVGRAVGRWWRLGNVFRVLAPATAFPTAFAAPTPLEM